MKSFISKSEYQKGIFAILLFGFFIFIFQLGSTGLIDETPPLFAAASRAMSETGNWLTPRVNGLNRFDKPPLIYWLMGSFYSIPGHDLWDPLGTWAARLPSAMSSLMMMLFLGDTLMKHPVRNNTFPRRTALVASLAFALSPIVIVWGRIAVSDALLCCTLGISLLLNWRTYVYKDSSNNWWSAWVVLGLAVLTKGPVAIVLTLMTLIIFGYFQKDYLTLIKKTKPLKGLCISVLISSPWYIAELIVEGKPFFDSFFGYHNLQRLTSVVNSHSQPWWFFVMMLLIASFPFTPFLISGLINYFYKILSPNRSYYINKTDNSLLNFAGSWLISVFILFTFAATKLPSYWLPATPAAAIIIALSSGKSIHDDRKVSIHYLSISFFMFLMAILLSNPEIWINTINDPEMPELASELLESGLVTRAAIYFYLPAFISLYFAIGKKSRNLILLQLPFIIFQIFVMLPIWKLADGLRQKPIREVAKQLTLLHKENEEPIAMVGIKKPSLHFYANKLIFYESNDVVALVNLSERLREENRAEWTNETTFSEGRSPTVLVVIDKKTNDYPHWQGMNAKEISSFGIYKLLRLDIGTLKQREILLKKEGVVSDWRKPRNERF
ncbi:MULTISPECIES: ArnT family glycosyltransferase [unclassified Prochlorococcus]|uniref:ArnT family glycosyltransferase n=1 Tax=unclassified Prochlorococcus TaxID=2627481 RepID=UPI0005339A8E|nr:MULTISPECIES: glycosyltransferase family 39 protein [unclassified Prochlorococcus]KGG16377.1 4-amino-4-deoxy-L-arabinose transferase and related glycosyltransferase of PMT family [Prochlorococcus sp. MIT 0603]